MTPAKTGGRPVHLRGSGVVAQSAEMGEAADLWSVNRGALYSSLFFSHSNGGTAEKHLPVET